MSKTGTKDPYFERLRARASRAAAWLRRKLHPRWSDAVSVLMTAGFYFPAVYVFDVHPLATLPWWLGLMVLITVYRAACQVERDIEICAQIDERVANYLMQAMGEEE